MSMPLVWTSSVLPYKYLCADDPPDSLFPGVTYNGYLCTLPRLYREELTTLNGMSVVRKRVSETSDFVIRVYGMFEVTWWPSYYGRIWEVDGVTGAVTSMGEIEGPSGAYQLNNFIFSKQENVWAFETLLGVIETGIYKYALDANGTKLEYTGTTYELSHWEGVLIKTGMAIDEVADVTLNRTNSTPSGMLSVHRLSTGELIRHIYIGSTPIKVMWDYYGKAYVLTSTGSVVLVNYETGEVHSVLSVTLPSGGYAFTYDFSTKRFYLLEKTSNAADGASTLQIRAYQPTPELTRLMTPVPLSRPTVGEAVTFLTRLHGDAGEPVSNGGVSADLTDASGTLVSDRVNVDQYGYARFDVNCTTDGGNMITVETD